VIIGVGSDCSSQITGLVYNDVSGNGHKRGFDERGLEGVKVILRDAKGDVVAEQDTVDLGLYTFVGLCAGAYVVEVDEATLPPDFALSKCLEVGEAGERATCLPATVPIEADDGAEVVVNVGFRSPHPGRFVGRVWNDDNENGNREQDVESGIQGVKVLLRDVQGKILARFTSRPSGSFNLQGLAAGEYELEVIPSSLPGGVAQTVCNEFGGELDNNCSPARLTIPDSSERQNLLFGYNE